MEAMPVEQAALDAAVRHESLYFADGDLVVATETNTVEQRTVLFRVHTVILAQHSPVFRDMLSFSRDGAGAETYDGVPLVRFQDLADDVAALFDTFYNLGHPLFKHRDPDFALAAHKLLDIARKYQVDALRTAVAHHLANEWPTTAHQFVHYLNEREMAEGRGGMVRYSHHFAEPDPQGYRVLLEPASTLRLVQAHDLAVPGLVPAALYLLATTNPEETWANRTSDAWYSARPARWELLDDRTLLRFYAGKHKLARRLRNEVTQVVEGMHPLWRCKGDPDDDYDDEDEDAELEETPPSEQCVGAATMFVHAFAERALTPEVLGRPDPIILLLRMREALPTSKICPSCLADVVDKITRRIEKIWNELPEIFGL